MLKLSVSDSAEKFRQDLKTWLSTNPAPPVTADTSLSEFVRRGREWQAALAAGGWVAVHWPKVYGGRGLSLVEEAIVQEELAAVQAPQLLGLFGLTMVGPVLIAHGSAAQKEKYLKDILEGKRIWCQGFSEPGAGSDLANIKTKAVQNDQGFLIQGQKIWTSFAHIADYCFILCRTATLDKPHKGLTYLLVDMKSPGITVRPLKQISGDEEFNEVFFDAVQVPAENVVGQVGSGWDIAISTLMYERVVLTFARQLQSESTLRALCQTHGKTINLELRQRLADELVNAVAVRALAYRHLLDYAQGKQPGPEGSLDKLLWSESFQRIARLAVDFVGLQAIGGELDPQVGAELHRYLYSRGRTIAAGTSEIQRNIIAERVLKLPRLSYQLAEKRGAH